MFLFLWVRASFPRYRYDQIMRLGWKVFIPVTLVWIVVTGVMMLEPLREHRRPSPSGSGNDGHVEPRAGRSSRASCSRSC